MSFQITEMVKWKCLPASEYKFITPSSLSDVLSLQSDIVSLQSDVLSRQSDVLSLDSEVPKVRHPALTV